MTNNTKAKFILIVCCVILAAILPGIAIAGFGIIGGLYLCIFTICGIISILTN